MNFSCSASLRSRPCRSRSRRLLRQLQTLLQPQKLPNPNQTNLKRKKKNSNPIEIFPYQSPRSRTHTHRNPPPPTTKEPSSSLPPPTPRRNPPKNPQNSIACSPSSRRSRAGQEAPPRTPPWRRSDPDLRGGVGMDGWDRRRRGFWRGRRCPTRNRSGGLIRRLSSLRERVRRRMFEKGEEKAMEFPFPCRKRWDLVWKTRREGGGAGTTCRPRPLRESGRYCHSSLPFGRRRTRTRKRRRRRRRRRFCNTISKHFTFVIVYVMRTKNGLSWRGKRGLVLFSLIFFNFYYTTPVAVQRNFAMWGPLWKELDLWDPPEIQRFLLST